MVFFRELRRRKVDKNSGNDSSPKGESSSTPSSLHRSNASTPASSIHPSQSTVKLANSRSASNNIATSNRPTPLNTIGNRASSYGLALDASGGAAAARVSQAHRGPCIASISENSWVHQKILLVSGTAGKQQREGTVVVHHHQDEYPATSWSVIEGHFQAFVHLSPGPNRLRLEYFSGFKSSGHSTWTTINYLPLSTSPPLHLAIVIGNDANNVDQILPKFRMLAYLWQTLTSEQMFRHGLGRRCFRFEEKWQPGTLSVQDESMRSEAIVHVIRSQRATSDLQQDSVFADIHAHFHPHQDLFVAALVLNGQEPFTQEKDNINIAALDAHLLVSSPANLEDIPRTDSLKTGMREIGSLFGILSRTGHELDDDGWHPLDALRLRYHPCFKIPTDPSYCLDQDLHLWPVANGQIIVTAPSGVAFYETLDSGDFVDLRDNEGSVPRQVLLPDISKGSSVKITSAGLQAMMSPDVSSKAHILKLPNGQSAFRGMAVGSSEASVQDLLLESVYVRTKMLTSIRVYHHNGLDGLEFGYEDSTFQLFGTRGEQVGDYQLGKDCGHLR